ncbi:ATP-binding protein [Candidatus Halobeggiatoa sp. HSG11]|nr:ATP-binding protein [Candidatus Halobeggiatoa sp. HSG11]
MNLRDTDITWINTAVGIIGILLAVFALGFIWGSVLVISTALLIIFLPKFSKSEPTEKPPKVTKSFTVNIGNENNLLPKEQHQIKAGKNPYVCGSALPGNSPIFYGRVDELNSILGFLRHPEQSGNVSVVGERRIGKSSLLNQVCQALAVDAKVITISTTLQEWKFNSQADFFASLHQAICEVIPTGSDTVVNSYDELSSFIEQQAGNYRFVFFVDEFDKMLENKCFDSDFFASMRILGYDAKYNWSYVLASLKPLHEITYQNMQESSFHNIFSSYPIGLLTEDEALALIREPLQGCFVDSFEQVQVEIIDYAGYHPAFIQMVAVNYWEDCHSDSSVNHDRIKVNLKPHCVDLWQHRNAKEQDCLLQIAGGGSPKSRSIVERLRVRGLLDSDNKLFSNYFKQVIDEFR